MRVTNFENLGQYQVSAPLNYEENYIMNLTSETVAILKNFSDINQNILVKPEQPITNYLYIEKHFSTSRCYREV